MSTYNSEDEEVISDSEEEEEERVEPPVQQQQQPSTIESEDIYGMIMDPRRLSDLTNSIVHEDIVSDIYMELVSVAKSFGKGGADRLLALDEKTAKHYQIIQTSRSQKTMLTFSSLSGDTEAYMPNMSCDVGCATRSLSKIVAIPGRLQEIYITKGGMSDSKMLILLALFLPEVFDPRLFTINVVTLESEYNERNQEILEELKGEKDENERVLRHIYHRVIQFIRPLISSGRATPITFGYRKGGGHAVVVYKLVDSEIMMVLDYQIGVAEVLDVRWMERTGIVDVTLFMDVLPAFEADRPTTKSFWDLMRYKAERYLKPKGERSYDSKPKGKRSYSMVNAMMRSMSLGKQ